MTSYKLIKKYPGSAPLNSIFNSNPQNDGFEFKETFPFFVSNKDVENTEYFKKIVVSQLVGKFIQISGIAYEVMSCISDDGRSFEIKNVNTDKVEIKRFIKTPDERNGNIKIINKYYFINSEGKIVYDFNGIEKRAIAHEYRRKIGNYFDSIGEAQQYVGVKIY